MRGGRRAGSGLSVPTTTVGFSQEEQPAVRWAQREPLGVVHGGGPHLEGDKCCFWGASRQVPEQELGGVGPTRDGRGQEPRAQAWGRGPVSSCHRTAAPEGRGVQSLWATGSPPETPH